MYILIVEDDKLQFNFIKDALTRIETSSIVRIRRIVTELEFRKTFEEIADDKPDVIIMDIMLRWTDPSPEMDLPPADIANEGFFRAGVRCEKMLAEDARTKEIPIMIYSVLEKTDLEGELPQRPQISYLDKDFDATEIKKRLKDLVGFA
jgi:CheY-like chemotaxis protein